MQATNLWVLHLTQEWEHCWPEPLNKQADSSGEIIWFWFLSLKLLTSSSLLFPPFTPLVCGSLSSDMAATLKSCHLNKNLNNSNSEIVYSGEKNKWRTEENRLSLRNVFH